jgi:hypothetical protein
LGIETIVEDWPQVKKRWEAWWQFGLYDRPLISVTTPKTGVVRQPPEEVTPEVQWTDAHFMVRRELANVAATYYGGEALPAFRHLWSVGHALYFGCQPHFARDTVWVDRAPVGPNGYPSFEGWQESPWWAWMQEATKIAVQGSQGEYFIMPMWGNHAGDNLALVLDPQRLYLEIADNPAWVKWAIKQVSDSEIQAFERLWQLVDPQDVGIEGSFNYVSCWSPKRTLAFDCDVSCMVSSRTFRQIFLPPLLETMHTVDHRIYNLDGTVALHHLDLLLGLPELHAIQWVPGAGHDDIFQWIPLIQKIQSHGKSLAIYMAPEQVEAVLRQIRPEGIFIGTSCATESDAKALIERVAKMY